MQLVHITAIVKNREGDGQFEIRCRYYITPEGTHLGRQVGGGWEGCGWGSREKLHQSTGSVVGSTSGRQHRL